MSSRKKDSPIRITAVGLNLLVKVVPGASRDQIAGHLEGRIKIRVSSPPTSGKANRAVCLLLSRELGVGRSAVHIKEGPTHPLKTIAITHHDPESLRNRLLAILSTGDTGTGGG